MLREKIEEIIHKQCIPSKSRCKSYNHCFDCLASAIVERLEIDYFEFIVAKENWKGDHRFPAEFMGYLNLPENKSRIIRVKETKEGK